MFHMKQKSVNHDRLVRCKFKNCGNFIYNKVYLAECWSVYASTKEPASYRVTDEDGDYYSIGKANKLDKHWEWVNE